MIAMAIVLTVTSCVSRKRADQAPSAVVNIYPAQSELIDENYFYSKWTQSRDPEGDDVRYKINYAQTMDGLDDPQFYETAETWFLFPNLEEGIWYWQVTAIDKAGNSTKSSIWTFTVNGETLPQPVDPEEIPTDPAMILTEVENTSFTLKWPDYEDRQNPSKAVEYVIYVYNQDNAVNTREIEKTGYWMHRIAPATTAHTTDTSHTFNYLNSNTLYDWVIVAQNTASQTSVVGSSQVRTGNRVPSQPVLLTPTEGATDVATDVTLSWSASVDPDGDVVKYYVYIDIIRNTNRTVTVEGIEETEYQPQGLEAGRTYYWFVLAKDSNGAATRTQINTFMTENEGMSVPASPNPADGSEGIDATAPPLLQWEHDKDGKQIEYSVYMSSNPKKIDRIAGGLTQKQYQIPGMLEGNTKYYWAVEAKDTGSDKTTRSGVWTFRTGIINPPVQTSAVTNADGTQIELTYDKAMADPSGKKDSYSVKKETMASITSRGTRDVVNYQTIAMSKIEMKAGTANVYVLTLDSAIVNGEKITIDYTPGTIQSMDGGKLAGFIDATVTNRVPGAAPLVGAATATANSVLISFDKDLKGPPAEAKTQFSVQSGSVLKQIESVTRTASDTYTISLKTGQEIAYGETVLISYTKGTVQAQNEAYLESFAGIGAENSVPPPNPRFVSGETAEDGQTVKVTFDREMADPTGKQAQFTADIQGTAAGDARNLINFTAATLNTANARIIELTLNTAVMNGQSITLDYTAGDVQSVEGASLESFTVKPVTNAVPAEIPVCNAATMTADGRHVGLAFSRDMRAPSREEANQFGVLVNGYVNEIDGATLSADRRVITLNLAKPVGRNNEVHVSYTRGTVSSLNGGLLESFQNKPVNTDLLTVIWVVKGIGWNYSSISAAIGADSTADGDVIMVATGTYNQSFSFGGKAVTVKSTYETDPSATSTTIIDVQGAGPAIEFVNGEDRDTIFEGFTVMNGNGSVQTESDISSRSLYPYGGALTISEASPTIRYNVFKDNLSFDGGAINVNTGSPLIVHNEFISNLAERGAAICLGYYPFKTESRSADEQGTVTVYGNLFTDNRAYEGAGIYIDDRYTVLNAEGNPWRLFNVPDATVTFVENTTTLNNRYTHNLIRAQETSSSRETVSQEGADIAFDGQYETTDGSLVIHPAIAPGNDDEALTIEAIYTIFNLTGEGSATLKLPDGISITTDASVTVAGGTKRFLSAGEIVDTQTVLLKNLTCGTEPYTITFNIPHHGGLKAGTYTFSMAHDADGEGTLYTISDATEAHLSIPNQYAVPEVDLSAPIEGIELATTTVTFTWEATPGTQTNTEAPAVSFREVYGIKAYIISFAGSDDVWASATINNGDTKEYATDVIAYGENYKWHVKAIGNNDKTTMTGDATFQTLYRLLDLGTEGETYTIIDEFVSDEYVISVDTDYLPARFTGQTRFRILVNDELYYFEQSELEANKYIAVIPYVIDRAPVSNDIDAIKKGIFDFYFPVYLQAGNRTKGANTIKTAVDMLPATMPATITLFDNEFKEGGYIFLSNHPYPVTFLAGDGFTPVLNGEDTYTGFFIVDSATITFKNLTFTHFNTTTYPGAALRVYGTDLNVFNCDFDNNSSVNGGAVFVNDDNSSTDHQFVLSESTLTLNTAVSISGSGYGGALFTFLVSKVILKDSYFATNTSLNSGGAMRLAELKSGYMENCRIEGNIAANIGGGIAMSVLSDYEINHTTVSENVAQTAGGGIQKTGAGNLTTSGNAWHIGSNPPENMQENFSVDDTGALKTGGAILENDSVHVQYNESYTYPEKNQMWYSM